MTRKKAECTVCGRTFDVSEMVKMEDKKTHYSYQCQSCHERVDGYHFEDFKQVGKTKKIPVTIGCEHEFSGLTFSQLEAVKILKNYGYNETLDSTVQREYKSPIIRNLNNVPKLLRTVYEGNDIRNDSAAATHVNVWCDGLSTREYRRIRNYYDILFKEFYEAVRASRADAKALFGRSMNGWCRGFSNSEHSCLVNTEACKEDKPRLELRICKYQKNEQFMNCLHFATDFMKTIIVNFLNHYMTDKEAIEMGKTAEFATKNNTHKAKVTAGKLARLYAKYVEKAYTKSTEAERATWQ